jgi:hypothetical protein
MVVQRDIIMRMVEKLADAFDEVVAEGAGDRQSLTRIDEALADAFRARPETLHLEVNREIDDLDGRMAAEAGRLLVVRSRIAERLGRAELSSRSLDFALRSLLQAADATFQTGESTPSELLRDLLREEETAEVLSDAEIAEAWFVVFRAEADRQNLTAAEDALFAGLELADWPDERVRQGLRFYQRVADLPDEVLDRRGLPREEVEEAVAELEQHLG